RDFGAASRGRPHLLISGPNGAGKFALASAIAHDLRQRVLVLDVRDWTTPTEVRAQTLRAARTAGWLDAMVYVHGVARLAKREPQSLRALLESLAETPARFVLASVVPLAPVPGVLVDSVRIDLAYPSCASRETTWRRALSARGFAADDEALQK